MSIFSNLSNEAKLEFSKMSAQAQAEWKSAIVAEHGLIETIKAKWPLLFVVFALGVGFGMLT
jgi:hypothetical protein